MFNGISHLELRPLCSADQYQLCNYARGHYEEHFCEIMLIWTSGSGGNVV